LFLVRKRITIITVAFNSTPVLMRMLRSVPAGTPVIIIDNSPQNDPVLRDLALQHGAQLVRNPRNLGFGVACNQGAALARTEFLLFLNPDAILDPGALDALVAAAGRYPQAAAMNPRISNADGSASFKRRSTLLPRSRWLPRGQPTADTEVPVLSRAAIFVRKAQFDAIGGFDARIFLYHEDDDLSLRLAALGPLMFIHDAHVIHQSGHSSGRSPAVAAFKGWHMGQSAVYAARKHKLPFGRTKALARGVLPLLSPAMLSRRKRAKHLGLLRGTINAILHPQE